LAQPNPIFQNLGTFNSPPATPPQVDATTFDNEGVFNIGLNDFSAVAVGNAGFISFFTSIPPFDFSDVLNYTNRGTMSCDTGFTFDFSPSTNGFRRMAATFGNANTGSIFAGSSSSPFTTNFVFFGANLFNIGTGVPIVTVQASNVVNTGLLDVGAGGLLQVSGNNLNLKRGTLHVEGFDDTNVVIILGTFGSFNATTLGLFNRYEGIGKQTNQISTATLSLPFPTSPFNNVTNVAAFPTFSIVQPPLASAFVNTNSTGPSNITIQVVFINTNLAGISTDVRFLPGSPDFATPIIQWQALITNNLGLLGQSVTTNNLYLADQFGSFPTNFLITNGFSLSGIPTVAPYNYSFFRSFPGYNNVPQGNGTFDPTLFINSFPQTNDYAAYGVTLAPVTTFPDPTLPGSTVTNTAGRIQINASTVLDLTSSKITGPNYLNLSSTNHFVGSANAQIVSPFMDINLGTTNGLLVVTNLVAPFVPRFTGPIDMWSGRWTNVVAGITNEFHILIVNAQLAPTALPLVLNCALRSTNVVISDILNIDQTLLVNSSTLTVTTNSPGSVTPFGEINIFSQDIIWSSSFPVLQTLTNFGLISIPNSVFFYGVRQIPYYPTDFNEPYQSFVNHGLITSAGNAMRAVNFENSGRGLVITNVITNASFAPIIVASTSNQSALIYSSAGPITLQANTALCVNGAFDAPEGDITIGADDLTITNHSLIASGALTFTVTNALTDGGGTSSNFWSVGDGINMLLKPGSGDLLGTTVTNSAPAGLEVFNTWAANDVGASASGFANNAALGHLILNGGDVTSTFFFGGPDMNQNYAIYVDQIELRNGASNRVSIGGIENFTAFDIDTNMTVYFADAIITGGIDVSEKLNGANGGHLVWVPSFAGPFSSTNLITSPGVTNAFNRALAVSTDIDSNGNGIANAFDPSPFYTSFSVNLAVGITNMPAKTPLITWSGLLNSTNYLYYKAKFSDPNWQLVTNFVAHSNGTISIIDHGRTNGSGYYQVRVNPPLP
jgi:hypothetical protein